jgi:choline/glycine/proline betaine transport protein
MTIINNQKAGINYHVFTGSVATILLFSFLMLAYPDASQQWLNDALVWVVEFFGWYYTLLMLVSVIVVISLATSRFGKLKLGAIGDKPEFSHLSWVSMLFSSGIGIALVYYGAYEPLDHFLQPPQGDGGTILAARRSMALTFLHWGLHGWALYALMATSLAWFAYHHNQKLTLRSALYPIFGDRINGWIGHFVDSFGILVTVISMVTNLGIGALLINSGLSHLLGIPQTTSVLISLVFIMMCMATLAVVTGIDKGIATLSNLNVVLLCLFLIFVFITGPTLNLINGLIQNAGDYLNLIVAKSFDMYLFSNIQKWQGSWTLFYWAWWVAWAPFVGLFIARISKGRTIRELIIGVLLIPLGFTLTWLSLFGNTAISLVLEAGNIKLGTVALSDPPMAIFELLDCLPWRNLTAGFTIIVSFTLFITPVDSGTLMISNLSSSGGEVNDDAPIWLRVFWSIITTLVCISLLYVSKGNFSAMQTAVVLCGLPFSLVIILYIIGLYSDLCKQTQ